MLDLTNYQKDHTCRKGTCLSPSVALVMFHFKKLEHQRKGCVVVRHGSIQREVQDPRVYKDGRGSGTLLVV